MDVRWLKRDDGKVEKVDETGGESDERGKAKKCVLKRDEDGPTTGSVDKTEAANSRERDSRSEYSRSEERDETRSLLERDKVCVARARDEA